MTHDFCRPFLKWAGGKYKLLNRIADRLPQGDRLIEPFVGAGAVFVNSNYDEYLLADINPDLIHLYQVLQQHQGDFIAYVRQFFCEKNNCPDVYYQFRMRFNACTDLVERAALFIYLNRHGYNGLCRYNRKGQYNVPFGRYKKPYFPEKEMLHFMRKSEYATFICADYSEVMRSARQGDVVYCDPPYVPLSMTANFTSYSGHDFNLEQQRLLATISNELAARGIPVLLSNHESDFTLDVYRDAQLVSFPVQRYISCNKHKREPVKELLALYTPV